MLYYIYPRLPVVWLDGDRGLHVDWTANLHQLSGSDQCGSFIASLHSQPYQRCENYPNLTRVIIRRLEDNKQAKKLFILKAWWNPECDLHKSFGRFMYYSNIRDLLPKRIKFILMEMIDILFIIIALRVLQERIRKVF